MDVAAARTAIYTWAAGKSPGGTTVYWGEPNGPRPASPSVRLKLVGGPTKAGLDELRNVVGNPNDFAVTGPRTLVLSVTTYGDTAYQAASDLATSLEGPDVQATLAVGGVASLSSSSPTDLSALLDTKFEQRFHFEVDLSVTESVTVQPGTVNEVDATGKAKDAAGHVVATAPLSVLKS